MTTVWLMAGLSIPIVLLLALLFRLVGNNKRREIRMRLGLPLSGRLSQQQQAAFMAFRNTEMKLKKSYPGMTTNRRQSIAMDVLRDKGLLPKAQRAA